MPLETFHPTTRAWFERNLGPPTEAQAQAWPAIQRGEHTLIAAPTGSGKTLAAFYAAIDTFIRQGLDGTLDDATQLVYVSPLKALSNDIHRNLTVPLKGIQNDLAAQGLPPVHLSVAVRTGDTTPSERQQMLKRPPHILVTTPESLYLLLTSAGGRKMLGGARTLIVDEIHALLGDKRGSHLALSIERLESLADRRLQRIGLSATQKPVETVARFLVGNASAPAGPPPCAIIDTGHKRRLDLSLEVPKSPLSALMSNEVWEELYDRLVELIHAHKTTLVFVNTRRLAERLALALREPVGEDKVSSHHGSMSKEWRHDAEKRLKAGQLKVLVATASMELGIDIGSVDLVVQFASPKRIATFLQRVGRSGHAVGQTPKGILFPLTRDDLAECTALLDGVRRGELDRLCVPEQPLDILAQQIVAEVSDGEWDLNALYALCVRAYPYRDLKRETFDEIVKMLADGFTTRRGRRGAFLHLDAIHGRVRARKSARLTALTNGGAIPDMFDYNVVLDPENIVVGSLNEDFALESLPGDIFTLGNHCWQLLRIEGLNVRVRDAQGLPPTIPFWFGEGPGRSRELSEAVSRLRQEISERIQPSPDVDEKNEGGEYVPAIQWLVETVGLKTSAAEQLVWYLAAGERALGAMPTRECIVMERFFDEVGDMHLVVHSPFGSRVNKGWGLALRKRFCTRFNFELQAAANEDSIVISLGPVHSFELKEVFHYLSTKTLEDILVQALLDTPIFEVRWRWNASRALAVSRNRNGTRVPPQLQRMQAEDLVSQVFPDQLACAENVAGPRDIPDHPLVTQTLNDCLTEALDFSGLMELIGSIEGKALRLIAKDLREPSPFAQEIINARPYAFLDDAPFEERRTNAVRHRRWLDPSEAAEYGALDADAISQVREEAWPQMDNADELHDGLMLVGFMKEDEAKRDDGALDALFSQLVDSGRATRLVNGENTYWTATERLPQLAALYPEHRLEPVVALPGWLKAETHSEEAALVEILRGRLEGLGPVTLERLVRDTGLAENKINIALAALETEGFVFRGRYTPGIEQEEWCERRLLQRIHKYTIEAHRQSVQPVSLQDFMRFLFAHHRLGAAFSQTGPESLERALELLEGIAAPAAAWESDILPARIDKYDPNWLDVLCISGRLIWGRFQAARPSANGGHRQNAVKSTPISILSRSNAPLWTALSPLAPEDLPLSSDAQAIEADLKQHGASFLDDMLKRTRLLKTQAESALGELVANGRAHNDSFTGLRSLLTPAHKKPGGHGRRRGRRAVFGIEHAGRWSLIPAPQTADTHPGDEAVLTELTHIYLKRWGVLFRKLLERETLAPPWRVLVRLLRKMELRGELRGGRFVAGVGGEQFAYPETVDRLRQTAKAEKKEDCIVLSAADPLNLLGVILPGEKTARLTHNRVLYEDGVPIAVWEAKEARYLKPLDAEKQAHARQALIGRKFPTRLNAYLGTRAAQAT